MRGNLLTINNLKDIEGKKVYVDCVGDCWTQTDKENYSGVCTVNGISLNVLNSGGISHSVKLIETEKYKINVYEWFDDIEKPKEYNLVEATQEMKDTKCHFIDVKTQKLEYALICGKLKFIHNNIWEEVKDNTPSFLLKKFIKLEDKSVAFITAITSGKEIKVEHEYLDDYFVPFNGFITEGLKALQQGKYISISTLFAILGCICDKDLQEITTKGRWFVRED